MDHHCPWLATCLGLHNYKAFVLFLVYISLFSWACFANTAWWMWKELFETNGYLEELAPVNIILLAVISGIIGLVITGFTSWHLYLCVRGQTTIEKLEKTRYLSGIRSRVERNRQDQQFNHDRHTSEGVTGTLQRAGEQLLEFHANAVPGASRYEEGEEHSSPVASLYNPSRIHHSHPYPQHPNTYTENAPHHKPTNDTPALRALRRTYSSIEADRERERYNEYLDDKETSDLPSAFDLGWRKNLLHLFGPNPLLWALPVCNTTGDGWRWEVSQKWVESQEDMARRKERRLADAAKQSSYGAAMSIRGGGGGGGGGYQQYERDRQNNDDNDNDEDFYSRSAMSMHTLPQADRGRRRQRRDFDQAENGERETFEVSNSSSSDVEFENDTGQNDSESDSDSVENMDSERDWIRRHRGRGRGSGRDRGRGP